MNLDCCYRIRAFQRSIKLQWYRYTRLHDKNVSYGSSDILAQVLWTFYVQAEIKQLLQYS